MKKLIVASTLVLAAAAVQARDYVSIVGSSTVYPFATVVAERYGRLSGHTPKIESTGSGGGFKLFCAGVGVTHPDITNASRAIKGSEKDMCASNGVKEIIEVKIGYDGIVLANSRHAPQYQLTLRDVYLALAKDIPNPNGSETWVRNPYTYWDEVNEELPHVRIEVLGPPPTSGTRDAFAELALEGGAKTFDWVKALKKEDKKAYKARAHTIREDGAYVEAGENDNLIVQKLDVNHSALGVFGFSFLDQNLDRVQGAIVNDVEPTFETIADNSYPVSRPLFFYVKKAHVGKIGGIKGYLEEFTSEKAMGEYGYLTDRGLIPLPAEEYAAVVERVKNLEPMD